jgi:hypothetical protein
LAPAGRWRTSQRPQVAEVRVKNPLTRFGRKVDVLLAAPDPIDAAHERALEEARAQGRADGEAAAMFALGVTCWVGIAVVGLVAWFRGWL